MGYVLTEEEQFLKDAAKDLLKAAPVAAVRQLRDDKDENGYNTDLWQQMVEVGWPGLAVSEDLGGLSFGLKGQGVVMEQMGRSLTAAPLHSIAVGAYVIEKFGSDSLKAKLENIVLNGNVTSIAVQEGTHYGPDSCEASVHLSGDTYVINGSKTFVADAHNASFFIINAQGENGMSTFLVPADSAGIKVEKDFMMDSRFYATVVFDNASISQDHLLGKEGQGKKVVSGITMVANALLSAELVGVMSEAFERTVAYLKERRQFDVVIGTFQGLQHRAADLYGEIELCKSISLKALEAIDQDDFMAPALASMAKYKCNKVAQLATNEGVQMFGGIGMTDDEEIGFFLKRARVAAQQYGSSSYHLDRFASMSGY